MLDCYGPMLDRPVIKDDFEPRYPILLSAFNTDLDLAKEIYDKQMGDMHNLDGQPPLNKNMPEAAGALKWSMELKARISNPMASFKYIEHP